MSHASDRAIVRLLSRAAEESTTMRRDFVDITLGHGALTPSAEVAIAYAAQATLSDLADSLDAIVERCPEDSTISRIAEIVARAHDEVYNLPK